MVGVAGAVFGGNESNHPGPWKIQVNNVDTGYVGVAALAPVANGPTAELVARAATQLDIGIPPAVSDQVESREKAWRAAVGLARMALGAELPPGDELQQPDLSIAEAWFGQSTGLAYTLAFLDSAPLNPTPGSIANGKIIAATGFVHSHKTLNPVSYIEAKYAAAAEAQADIFILPGKSYRDAIENGLVMPTDSGPRVIPVRSPREAVYRLCESGGEGKICDAVQQGRFLPQPTDSDAATWLGSILDLMNEVPFSTGPRGIPGARYDSP